MTNPGFTQLSVGEEWLERCQHSEMAPLYADGRGLIAKQCGNCLRVFPWKSCAMCGRQTVMRERSRDAWFCSKGCRRQSAAIEAKGGGK